MASLEQQNSGVQGNFGENATSSGPSIVVISASSSSTGSMVEQDCKISSSNHNNPSAGNAHSNGITEGNGDVPRRPFLCGTTVATSAGNGVGFAEQSSSVEATPAESESNPVNCDDGSNDGLTSSGAHESNRSRNSVGDASTNLCDSVSSSSTNASYNPGGGVTDGEQDGSGESIVGVGNYRVSSGVPEDDAGSSSHSEVRSSSPGIADADADVEDSPSGSEETGSESEQRINNSANNIGAGGAGCVESSSTMYAPNTVGFPPSRSTGPSGGCFGSSLKYSSGGGSNPFAVKAASPSSGSSPLSGGERCTSSTGSNSNHQASSFSSGIIRRGSAPLISPGRWNTASNNPISPKSTPSWNSKPIIRPSALGGGFGSQISTTSSFGQIQTSQFPNYFAMGGTSESSRGPGFDSGDSNSGAPSKPAFVLRPPRLAATSSFSAISSVGSTVPEPSAVSMDGTGSEADNHNVTVSGAESKSRESSQGKAESSVKFVPLAKDGEPSNTFVPENATPGPISSTSTNAGESAGFVFGQGLQERVQNPREGGFTNGISSSSSEGGGGLFSSALRNLQKDGENTNSGSDRNDDEAGPSSTSESQFAFGNPEDANSADRKRRYDDGPVITGEEDELNVLQIMCRLFIFDSGNSSWTERGRGQLRLNDRNDPDANELRSRLIIRTKGSLRLMLNTNVWSGMKVDRTSSKSVRFMANENGQIRLFLVMVTVGEADQLYNALDWRIKNLKQQEELKCSGSVVCSENNPAETSVCDDENLIAGADNSDDDDDLKEMPTKKKRYIASEVPSPDHGSRKNSADHSGVSLPSPCSNQVNTPSIRISNHDSDDIM